jgi:hypothetical protein
MSLIHIENLNKHLKILNRREGLSGALRDLFWGNHRTAEWIPSRFLDLPGSCVSSLPMTIFDTVIRFAFTCVIPIGFVAFHPSQIFLRPHDVSPLMYLSAGIGMGLFAVRYWIWTQGVNPYAGTGS